MSATNTPAFEVRDLFDDHTGHDVHPDHAATRARHVAAAEPVIDRIQAAGWTDITLHVLIDCEAPTEPTGFDITATLPGPDAPTVRARLVPPGRPATPTDLWLLLGATIATPDRPDRAILVADTRDPSVVDADQVEHHTWAELHAST